MEEKIPGCGIKGQPHIDSCIKLLKKQYNAIAEMLGPSASGFGWNDVDKCIDADKDVFENWVKSHPGAKSLLRKPFPHYDDLSIVFGKDHANGYNCRPAGSVIEELDRDVESGQANLNSDYNDLNDESEPVDNGATRSATQTPTTQHNRKRRRQSSSGDELITSLTDAIGKFSDLYRTSSQSMSQIANSFQSETDANQRRMNIFSEVKKIDGLSPTQVLRAGHILSQNKKDIDYFFSLDDEYKFHFIMMKLGPD